MAAQRIGLFFHVLLAAACQGEPDVGVAVDGGGVDAAATDAAAPDGASPDGPAPDATAGAACEAPPGAHESVGDAIPAAPYRCDRLAPGLIAPRDVIVTDAGELLATESGAGRIVRWADGAWTTVADGLRSPIGLREADDGSLYVAEEGANTVSRIDVSTGERTVIASDLGAVTYLTIGPDEAIYVSSFREVARTGTGVVKRVDPATGTVTAFATGMHVPEGLLFDGEGRLIVIEWTLPSAVLRFDAGGGPASAAETLASGFDHAYGLARLDDGTLLVGDHAGRIARIDPAGDRDDLLTGTGKPGGIWRTEDGTLWLAEFVDFGATGYILRLSP